MAIYAKLETPKDGQIIANITHFARALRHAGLPIGSGQITDAIRAVDAVGFTSKPDFFWTLHAVFVSKPAEHLIFAQVFRLYWRDPQFLEHIMAILMPAAREMTSETKQKPADRRAAQALLEGSKIPSGHKNNPEDSELEFDASLTFSKNEKLKTLDFEQMSMAETAEAKKMIARIVLPVKPLASRRKKPAPSGALPDWRATMRHAMRSGGDIQKLARKQRQIRWPDLVALCDISGSMSSYSRMVLHFLHAASIQKGAGWSRVHSFTFGTRLTNITRHLQNRDVDAALAAAGAEARDWEGGTRIGECLHRFNRQWSRRILGGGAVVLLITDGLERDEPGLLAAEMEHLQLSARKVIWLNPLLRFDGFAPKARGIREILPFVDSFRAGHNINSLEALADALSKPEDTGEKNRMIQMLKQS